MLLFHYNAESVSELSGFASGAYWCKIRRSRDLLSSCCRGWRRRAGNRTNHEGGVGESYTETRDCDCSYLKLETEIVWILDEKRSDFAKRVKMKADVCQLG